MNTSEGKIIGSKPGKGPGPEVMAASTLTGNDGVKTQAENLGHIKVILLNVPSGRIAYAVLSFGGFLGAGDKLFAVPWSALTLDTDNKCFLLEADKELLKDAPGFDKDDWPSMSDRQWATSVHRYYGAQPYWE